MSAQLASIDVVIRETRALFHDLKAYADRLHEDESVNASVRAILEHLHERGEQTVPTIAREKNVTRQHIQQIVDLAMAAGLAESRPNPAHKRSVLIALTPAGAAAFARMRERETHALHRLAPALINTDLAAAAAALRALRKALAADRPPAPETTFDANQGDTP